MKNRESYDDLLARLHKVEDALERSNALFRTTFEHSFIGMAHLDSDGKFLRVNQRFSEITGYSKKELLTLSVADITVAEDLVLENPYIEKVLQNTLDTFSIEKRYYHKKGHIIWVHLNSSVVRDEQGNVGYAIAAISDITEKKQMEEELRKNEALFHNMLQAIPDMVSIHDSDLNILYSNWNGFAAVPKKKQKLNTKCYKTYRGYDVVCPDCRARTVLETKTLFQEDVELPDGTWVDLRVIPLLDHKKNCTLFV